MPQCTALQAIHCFTSQERSRHPSTRGWQLLVPLDELRCGTGSLGTAGCCGPRSQVSQVILEKPRCIFAQCTSFSAFRLLPARPEELHRGQSACGITDSTRLDLPGVDAMRCRGRELADFLRHNPSLQIAGDSLEDCDSPVHQLFKALSVQEWVRWDSNSAVNECAGPAARRRPAPPGAARPAWCPPQVHATPSGDWLGRWHRDGAPGPLLKCLPRALCP